MSNVIDPEAFGVSFSRKQCRNLDIDAYATLRWLIDDAGFRRFRLMSYWNDHEPAQGEYDFSGLDWQFALAEKHGCQVTLCLGARQPRWPENHWPQWAWELPKPERSAALLTFIQAVIKRYKNSPALVSYQLENEALLKNFGERPEIDRPRLRQEYALVKQLDPGHPVIMTTSTSWGIPLRKPIPDFVGFSYYQVVYNAGIYHTAFHTPRLHRLRAKLIKWTKRRPTFVHELQLEPWGPDAIWKISIEEQDKSMGVAQIHKNVALARKTKLQPIDLWGGEWWYWRLATHNDPSIWQAVRESLTSK
jgi:hypothetical protein